MKYIIDIPKEYESDWVNKSSRLGFELCFPINETATNKKYHIPTGLKLEPYTEPDREAIENEVWEFAKIFMDDMGVDDLEVVNGDTIKRYFAMTYQEAKSKYDAWKSQKEELHIGDEVIYNGDRVVVTDIFLQDITRLWIEGVTSSGKTVEALESDIKKTGRHFDEIEELLKKLVGEQE